MKVCNKRKQIGDRFRSFKDYYSDNVTMEEYRLSSKKDVANDAWDYQAKYIELLESKIRGLRSEVK
jgi:hypothetical protein